MRPPRNMVWGRYSGSFANADGHLWEVARNPFFPLDEQERLFLPDHVP